MASPFAGMSVDDVVTSGRVGANLELLGRQATAQINAAKYMLWSVVAIMLTSGATALFAFLSWYFPHH
jgi:hypothetical protein